MNLWKKNKASLRYFRNLITLLLLTLSTQLSINAQNQQKNFLDTNYIEVTGTVESKIIPDKIYISITINEKDKKGKVSVETQEAKMLQQLRLSGIDLENNLSVQNFNSAFNTYFLKKDDVLKVKQYSLLVNNMENLTKAFKIFDRLEISNVYISKVDHSKMEELKLDAKIKAIKIAKKKAITYAQAIDQNVGKALLITEKNSQNYNPSNAIYGSRATNVILRGYSQFESQNKAIEDKINFKEITIIASVEAKFELK